MDSKDHLVKTIKEWVRLDNEIKALQKEVSLRKNEKKKNSETLMQVMKKNEIDCFDIKDGQICYVKRSTKKPITKKMLFDVLVDYFKNDIQTANDLNNFISESREEVIKESIEIKPIKKE